MRRRIVFIFLLFSVYCTAQTEADIRKHYTEVNKQITESVEKGFEGSLYNNHWETNKNGKSWPAVGRYSEITDFWYDDDPNHLPATERNPKNVLLKVTVSRKAAGFNSGEEYLFKDGKLLFYYSSQAEEGSRVETRLYFNSKGVMFKSSVKSNELELTAKDFLDAGYKEFKPNPIVAKAAAVKYRDLFVKSM
jgi:hypothetical protein